MDKKIRIAVQQVVQEEMKKRGANPKSVKRIEISDKDGNVTTDLGELTITATYWEN